MRNPIRSFPSVCPKRVRFWRRRGAQEVSKERGSLKISLSPFGVLPGFASRKRSRDRRVGRKCGKVGFSPLCRGKCVV